MTTKRQAEGYLIHHLLGKFTTCLRHHISSRDVSVSALYGKLLAEKPRLYQEWVTFLRYQELILERHESLFDIYFDELWVPMALEACSEYAKARMVNPYATEETILAKIAPVFSEFEVDGTPLGFSDICRLDYFTPFGIIVEVKTTYPDDMHRLAAAAYGLSVEASFEIPVDHALIQYIWMQSSGHLRVAQRLVPLTDSLRMRAVEVRDHRARILAEGIDPAPDERCTAECPFSGLAVNE